MAKTRAGVLITKRFLRRDKRDMLKFRYMVKLHRAGKLKDKGEREMVRLLKLHNKRYGPSNMHKGILTPSEFREQAEKMVMLVSSLLDAKAAMAKIGMVVPEETPSDRKEIIDMLNKYRSLAKSLSEEEVVS